MERLSTKGRVGNDLTEGHVMRTLIIFAVPMVLANLVQQFYNTVDLIVVGKFAGSAGTVGTSQGGDYATLMSMVAQGFSTAGQIYIAQLVGAREHDKIRKAIGTLFTLMMCCSVAVAIFGCCANGWFLGIMHTPEEALRPARQYMFITSLGTPFVFGYNAVCGVLRGKGESKRPLEFIIVAAVTNIVLDLFFAAVLKIAVVGTAIATVMAQAASFFMALRFMYRHKEQMDFDFKLPSFRPYKEQLKVILRLGSLKAAQGALLYISMLYCSARVNAYGLVAAATNNIGNKVGHLSNVITISVDGAAAGIIGQSLGARKPERVKKAVYSAMAIAMTMAVLNTLLAIVCPRAIYHIFSDDPEVIEFGVTFLRIMIVSFIVSGVMGPCNAVITGDGNAPMSFVVGVVDGVVLRIGLSLLFAEVFDMGVVGYFLGNSLARVGPTFVTVIYFYSGHWKKRKLLSDG